MKKLILSICAMLALAISMQAQSPDAFNYQALVRDAAGQVLPNTQVAFRISLSDPASTAAPTYTEIHHATTDAFGRVALQIGQGNPERGLFNELDWSQAQYTLQVELDAQGGTDFVSLGNAKLLSVPYALHAQTVENDQVEDADADPKNELQRLHLVGDTLHISDGNYVLLPATMTGNPESGGQTLSLANDTLSISDGNGVFMEDYLVGEMIEALEENKLLFDHPLKDELAAYQGESQYDIFEYEVWQSFTPTVSGILFSVEMDFRTHYYYSYSIPDSVTLNIYEGEGTQGTLLCTGITAVESGNYWYSLDIPCEIVLSADSLYTFEVADGDGFRFCYEYLDEEPTAGGPYSGGIIGLGLVGEDEVDLRFAVTIVPEGLTTSIAIGADPLSGMVSLYDSTLNITKAGNVGIGTSSPTEKLHVVGSVRIEDGSEQEGYFLSCDADGKTTWTDVASVDNQTLSLSGGTLSISDGNSVDISNLKDSNFSLSHANAGSTTKILTIEGKRDNGISFGAFAEIQFKNTDGNSGGSGNPYVGAKIAAANTDGSDDGDLRFYTYNGSLTQQMIITNDGEFGFGIDDPAYAFDVVQSKNSDYVARIKNTANSNGSGDDGLLIQAGHNSYNSSNQSAFIQFETPSGTYCGRIKQDGGSSVNYYDASDRRLKENIRDTRYGLADLLKIQVRDYNYIADGPAQQRTGFIAQELHEVYPTAVDKGGDDVNTDPWSVAYGKLTPVLVQAVQDQQELIEAQEEELSEQGEMLHTQQTELESLRQVPDLIQGIEARIKALEANPSAQTGLISK